MSIKTRLDKLESKQGPGTFRVWLQDDSDPGLFHCGDVTARREDIHTGDNDTTIIFVVYSDQADLEI